MRYALLLMFVCVIGCSPIATYPSIETEAVEKLTRGVNKPVPKILATTIEYAHTHFGGMDHIVFNLPLGMGTETYLNVSQNLGGGTPMSFPQQPAYHIIELRVRGFSADADVLFPSAKGGYQTATIHLESSLFKSWRVTRDRVWIIPVGDVPKPNDPATLVEP